MKIDVKDGRMSVVDFNEFDACRIALAIEDRGAEFYGKLVGACTKPEVKEVFSFLVNEEKRHSIFFENELERLRQDKEDVDEEDDLIASMEFGIFPPRAGDAGCPAGATGEALEIAIAAEERSIQFYELCLMNVTSPDTKKTLLGIIGEEKKHKALLEKIKAAQ